MKNCSHPQNIKNLQKFCVLVLGLLIIGANNFANDCWPLYQSVIHQIHNPNLTVANPTPEAVNEARTKLIAYLRAAQIPAFVRKTPNGDIPVILLNKNTYEKLGYVLDNSLGMAVSLHPGGGTDHGMFRNRTKLIDLYNPGQRAMGGEFHNTGIAWKDLSEYFPRRQADSRKILDLAYLVSPQERADMDYYHRVRRAAVFRAPYANWGAKIDNNLPQHLCSGAEHCYTFPNGSGASAHIQDMKNRVGRLGVKNFDEFYKSPEIQTLLHTIQSKFLSADPHNHQTFYYKNIIDRPEHYQLLDEALGDNKVKNENKLELMAYITGIDASQKYINLLNQLRIDQGRITKYENPRATALFIYDEDPAAVAKFQDATYETISDNYSFRRDAGNVPLAK